jgi:hypothetical protein
MTAEERWRLAIQAIGVLISTVIAAMAIWGDFVRSCLAGPRLTIGLVNPEGERTVDEDVRGGVAVRSTPVRYYHLRIQNQRRSAPAKNVRVVLTRFSRAGADGVFREQALTGPLQMKWQFPKISPREQTLGPDQTCDLGFLLQGGPGLNLACWVTPRNLNTTVTANDRIRVELRAVAENAESRPLYVEIAWDGTWVEDSVEMRRHLIVKAVDSIC